MLQSEFPNKEAFETVNAYRSNMQFAYDLCKVILLDCLRESSTTPSVNKQAISCKFHMKGNLISTKLCFQNIFHQRSKLLNETHISLNEDVFPLNKRVKHL